MYILFVYRGGCKKELVKYVCIDKDVIWKKFSKDKMMVI